MSEDDSTFDSTGHGEILGPEGRLYKRNVMAFSAGLIAIAAIPGATLDASSLPLVRNVSELWIWIGLIGILLYNSALLLYHHTQDNRSYLKKLLPLHIGFPDVLFTGKARNVTTHHGSFSFHEIGKEPKPPTNFLVVRTDEGQRKSIEKIQMNDDEPTSTAAQGQCIHDIDFEHLKAKHSKFLWMDLRLPYLLLLLAVLAAGGAMSGIAHAETTNYTITDGDTIRIGEERIRIIGLDTPEVFKPQCLAEKMLGERATVRLGEILSSGAMTLDRKGLDKYRRTLAIISIDGKDVAPMMIDEGLAMKRRPKDGWCKIIATD